MSDVFAERIEDIRSRLETAEAAAEAGDWQTAFEALSEAREDCRHSADCAWWEVKREGADFEPNPTEGDD